MCLFSCLLHCSTVRLSVHLNLSVQQYISLLNWIFLSLNVCLFVQLPWIPCSSSLFVCPHTQYLCLHILLIPPFLTFSLSFDPILCPSVTSSLFLYQLVFNQTSKFLVLFSSLSPFITCWLGYSLSRELSIIVTGSLYINRFLE